MKTSVIQILAFMQIKPIFKCNKTGFETEAEGNSKLANSSDLFALVGVIYTDVKMTLAIKTNSVLLCN